MNPNSRNALIIVVVILIVLIGALWFVTHQGGSSQIGNLPATSTPATATSTATTSKNSPAETSSPARTPVTTRQSSGSSNTGTGTSGHPIVAPRILEFVPAGGATGTVVTIKGTNFDSTTNYITFGTSAGRHHPDGTPDNVIAVVGSTDGSSVTFTVPSSGPSGLLCDAQNNCVAISATRIQPGSYPVTVTTKAGVSNTVMFTVISS